MKIMSVIVVLYFQSLMKVFLPVIVAAMSRWLDVQNVEKIMINIAHGIELLAGLNWLRLGHHGTISASHDVIYVDGPSPMSINEEAAARLKEYGFIYSEEYGCWSKYV